MFVILIEMFFLFEKVRIDYKLFLVIFIFLFFLDIIEFFVD